MNNTLLVKNILYAISIGVVVNVTLTTPALANIKTDTIIEDKASINIVQEQYLHLSEINLNDIKQIDNNIKLIDKNKKLSVEDVKTFNKNRIIQEDESKWQNDFKDKVIYNKGLNQDIDNNINNIEQDEFNDIVDDFKINKQETINKNNNSKYAVELNDDVFIKEKMNKKNNSHPINYKYANLTNDERNAIREDAVIKAREGNYNYALNILDNLYKSEKTDYKTINDYITILNWAGKYQEAIDVYEKNKYDGMPDYVLLNIASSYYRIMNLNKACSGRTAPAKRRSSSGSSPSWWAAGSTWVPSNTIPIAGSISIFPARTPTATGPPAPPKRLLRPRGRWRASRPWKTRWSAASWCARCRITTSLWWRATAKAGCPPSRSCARATRPTAVRLACS